MKDGLGKDRGCGHKEEVVVVQVVVQVLAGSGSRAKRRWKERHM